MKAGLRETITSRGFWRVNFRPTTYRANILTLNECRTLVEKNSVEKRGWDYPHVPSRQDANGGMELLNNCVQGWVDWSYFRELWRMYQSGQFIHLAAIRNDWSELDEFPPSRLRPGQENSLEILDALYEVSEMLEFLSRLANGGIYDGGAEVSISLVNTKGRSLTSDRGPMSIRTTEAEAIQFDKVFSRAEIALPRECAFDVVTYLFDRFGWNPAADQVRSMQDSFYAMNLGRG